MKGTYCLIIKVEIASQVKVGSLGSVKFAKGRYVYVGSALNGLEKRVARHLRQEKRLHWHIDYLLAGRSTAVEKVLYRQSNERQECEFTRLLESFGEPVDNFGSSDCKCNSHLFRVSDSEEIDRFAKGFKCFPLEGLEKP